jgi:lipopolysaccharide transport system permease protein
MIAHLTGVYRYRYFWGSLVRLDLRNRYRRSVLGIGWSLLQPLAMAAVFATVFSGIMGQSDWRTYVPFLIVGLTVWDFLKNGATVGCDSFVRAEAYIRQHPLPFAIYPLRSVLGNFVHFSIAMLAGVGFTAYLQDSPQAFTMLPVVLPAIVMAFVFSWGVATVSAFAHVYFHDTKHLLDVGSQIFFFLTPVMYARKVLDDKQLGWLADLNPIVTYLELIRTPLISGEPPSVSLIQQGVVLTVVSFGLGCGTLAWLQKKIVFQL